jgi:hypothetical protein
VQYLNGPPLFELELPSDFGVVRKPENHSVVDEIRFVFPAVAETFQGGAVELRKLLPHHLADEVGVNSRSVGGGS